MVLLNRITRYTRLNRLNRTITSCSHGIQIAFALALALGILIATAPHAHADVLFEGYSKVLLSGEHVGYTVVRYEFDSKKQEFTVVSLLRTNAKGGNLSESIKARASSSLKPRS